MKKYCIPACILMLVSVLFLGACSREKTPPVEDDQFNVYYIEVGKSELYAVSAVLDENLGDDNLIPSVYAHMQTGGDEANYTSAVPQSVTMLNYSIEEGNLVLNFDAAYSALEKKDELIFRAALVKTFTQLEFVSTVEIRVEDQPLITDGVNIVGPQRGSDFVDVIGNSLNGYSRADVTLYFSDESGTRLVPRTRTIVYSNASTLESQVLNSLISGPDAEDEGAYRTLPANVRSLSVGTVAGVCSVNLSDAMLSEASGVSPEVCIYSIVNSLSEISGISSVQISINGSSNMVYMDQVDLSENLKQNLDLILAPEETSSEED